MKKSNLLILICCLLFSIGGYAQYNNLNLARYNNGEIDFEFVPELIYINGEEGELLGTKVTVTNIGNSPMRQDISFRVHISGVAPSELPDSYNIEEVLMLSRYPLPVGGSDDIFIDLHRSRSKVITIWPLLDLDNPIERQDIPYIVMIIPPIKANNKKASDQISGISMYPNPTYKNLHIEMPDGHVADQIIIYDKTGQLVKTFKGKTSDLIVLDLNGLLPDMYFVTIKNKGGQIIHYSKLILKN